MENSWTHLAFPERAPPAKDVRERESRENPQPRGPAAYIHAGSGGPSRRGNPARTLPLSEITITSTIETGTEAKATTSTAPVNPKWEPAIPRPTLHTSAYYGLAGEIARAIEPETEADPAGILFELLAAFGNAVGRNPYVALGAVYHGTNLDLAKIGATSKGRKGQGWAEVKRLMSQADATWAKDCLTSGLSTGEGLIASLSDRTDKDGNVVTPDKRALIIESEFARVLRVAARDKNTLIDTLRDAWDGITLRVKTRKDPLEAADTHITLIGHCTVEEITKVLDDILVANGFANRFLFCFVERTKKLPFGGNFSAENIKSFSEKLRNAIERARKIGLVTWSKEAKTVWKTLYDTAFECADGGLTGALIARGESHTVRLSLNFALLDGKNEISLEHLRAAYACWRYSEDSTRFIFQGRLGDPVEQRLLDAARDAYPDGLDGTAQDRATGGKQTPKVRKALVARGLLREERGSSGEVGRSTIFVFAVPLADFSDKSDLLLNPLDDSSVFPINPKNPKNPQEEEAENILLDRFGPLSDSKQVCEACGCVTLVRLCGDAPCCDTCLRDLISVDSVAQASNEQAA
jgi:hypothetical protein